MSSTLAVLLIADLFLSNALLWEPKGIKEVRWFISEQCRDSKGNNGTCLSLPGCFPDPDIPQLSGWKQFITGNYDSCAYLNSNGKPFVGACCTNSGQSENNEDDDLPSIQASSTFSSPVKEGTTPSIVGDDPVEILIPVPKPQPTQLPIVWPPTHAPLPTHAPFPTFKPFTTNPWFTGTVTPRPITTTTTWRPWWRPFVTERTTTPRPTSSSQVEIPTECGRRNNSFRVVGGQKSGYWPWVAGLLGRRGLFCGGSLVTNYHILTAAHCVTGLSPNDLTVRLGDLDLTNTSDRNHVDVKVSSIIINPSYNSRTNHQDVAILRLKSKVAFTSDISPICLPSDTSRNYAGQNAIVIGWGATRLRGPTSKVLNELNLRIWPVSECQTKFQANFPNQIIPSNICAGDGGKDACSGDSGGPLMKHDNGIYSQIGVVSWGVGCGTYRYPGIIGQRDQKRQIHYPDHDVGFLLDIELFINHARGTT
ncbi:Serine protease [Chamberlinius hualienensis]